MAEDMAEEMEDTIEEAAVVVVLLAPANTHICWATFVAAEESEG